MHRIEVCGNWLSNICVNLSNGHSKYLGATLCRNFRINLAGDLCADLCRRLRSNLGDAISRNLMGGASSSQAAYALSPIQRGILHTVALGTHRHWANVENRWPELGMWNLNFPAFYTDYTCYFFPDDSKSSSSVLLLLLRLLIRSQIDPFPP